MGLVDRWVGDVGCGLGYRRRILRRRVVLVERNHDIRRRLVMALIRWLALA